MGQMVCHDERSDVPDDDTFSRYSASLLRESKMTLFIPQSKSGSGRSNVCKELGLGEYLAEQWKVSRMWTEVLKIMAIINEDHQRQTQPSEFFLRKRENSGQVVISTSELFLPVRNEDDQLTMQQVRQKHPYVVTEEDQHMFQFHILDRKGLSLLLSLGPPRQYRWSAWKTLILFNQRFKSKYEDLLSKGIVTEQINMDLQRTLVSHKFFQKACLISGGFGQMQLLRVLQGITTTLPTLGYCQGMNFLVGFLLMVSGCDEHLTFQVFYRLLTSPKYLLYFVFCDHLPLVHLMSAFIHQVLQERDPELYNHLTDNLVPDSFWITKMLMSMFLYVCSLENCLRLWDHYISRGLFGMVELSLGIVHNCRDQILVSDIESIGMMFQGQSRGMNDDIHLKIDIEKVIHDARRMFWLKKSTIVAMTKSYLQEQQRKEKRKSLEFEILFLDFENQELFKRKVEQFMNAINIS